MIDELEDLYVPPPGRDALAVTVRKRTGMPFAQFCKTYRCARTSMQQKFDRGEDADKLIDAAIAKHDRRLTSSWLSPHREVLPPVSRGQMSYEIKRLYGLTLRQFCDRLCIDGVRLAHHYRRNGFDLDAAVKSAIADYEKKMPGTRRKLHAPSSIPTIDNA